MIVQQNISEMLKNLPKQQREHEQKLLDVFLEQREVYNNEQSRNTFMGYKLNNLGLN
jgi:hypothetical protein